MMDRPIGRLPERRLLLHGWTQLILLQALVALATLLMLHRRPGLTVAATVVNVVGLLNTLRIRRTCAGHHGAEPLPGTGRDLATVALSVVGSALMALALMWP